MARQGNGQNSFAQRRKGRQENRGHYFDEKVLVKLLRALVTVYLPSGATETLSRLAGQLAVGPRLAIICSSVLTSFGVPRARCPCQMSWIPGDFLKTSKTVAGPPLRGPLFITATRG